MDERAGDGSLHARFAWLVAGSCAVLAGALTLLATRHGVTVDQDSATYLSAARNLASGRGYEDFTGTALTNFPPLFPAVVRAAMWVVPTAATAARLTNVVASCGSVVLAFVLIRRHVRSPAIVAGATLIVASSIGLLHVADKALSEPLFWMFVLAFVLVVETAMTSDGRRAIGLYSFAGLLFGFAFLTRYAAVALLAVGVGTILFSYWRARGPGVMLRLVALVATGAVLPALWIARNAGTDNKHLIGPRVGSGVGPVDLVRDTAGGVGSLFLPQGLGRFNEIFFWGLAIAAAVGALVLRRLRADGSERKTTLVPLTLLLFVYVPFIAWTNATSGTSLDFRVFSPIYVPVVVVIASFVDDVYSWSKRTNSDALRNAILVAGGLLVVVAGVGALYDAWHLSKSPHGYATAALSDSPLARRVEALPAGALVASNDPYRLYGVTGREPIVLSPGVEGAGISVSPTSLDELTTHAACRGPVYLAWWSGFELEKTETPAQLSRHAQLVPVDEVRDGTLYSLRPSTDAPTPAC
jgi:hypothetical protein